AGKSDDATARADETRAARHFATRGVSDFSFDAVLEIERLILISLRDLEWNLDPALRIEPHVAIFHHVVAVTVITTFVITLFTLADVIAFVITIPPPVVIAGTINIVMYIGIGHGCTEEILCFDNEFGLLANRHKSLRS